jgi:hypothetical protein
MDAKIQALVGPAILSDGVVDTVRMGKTGELIVAELHGKYALQTYRGNVFWACMLAGVIFPAPAATAANVMTLANPAGSGKNMNLISFDMVFTIIPGTPLTGLYGLYVNTNVVAAAVTGTAIVPVPGLLGGKTVPVGTPLSTSTVPAAPTLLLPFGQKVTGEVVTAFPLPAMPSFHIEFDGKVSLAPGSAITPQQTVADTTNGSVICAFCWEEVAV